MIALHLAILQILHNAFNYCENSSEYKCIYARSQGEEKGIAPFY